MILIIRVRKWDIFSQNKIIYYSIACAFQGTQNSLSVVLFSHSAMSSSFHPHGLKHTGFPFHHHLLELPQTHIHWVSDAIQPSHLLSSPSLPTFNLSQHQCLFQDTDESVLHIRWPKYRSFSFDVRLSNEYSGLFPLELTGFIFLQFKGHSRVFSRPTVQKHQFFGAQSSLWSNSHIHTWLLEYHSFDYMDLCWQIMSLLFNVLSRLVIAFLPRSKCLLISWLHSPSAVILGAQKNKVSHCFPLFPQLIAKKWWDQMPWSLFSNVEL